MNWFTDIFIAPDWHTWTPATLYRRMHVACPDCALKPPRYIEHSRSDLCVSISCARCGEGFTVAPMLGVAESIGQHPRSLRRQREAKCQSSTTSKPSTKPPEISRDILSVQTGTIIDPVVPRRQRTPSPLDFAPPRHRSPSVEPARDMEPFHTRQAKWSHAPTATDPFPAPPHRTHVISTPSEVEVVVTAPLVRVEESAEVMVVDAQVIPPPHSKEPRLDDHD